MSAPVLSEQNDGCQSQWTCLNEEKDSGACLLVVHVYRTVYRVVGHQRPSLAGIGVPWVSLPGPTDVVVGVWSALVRVSSLITILDSRSLECENTYMIL